MGNMKKREAGFELLRIISMMMIVMLHLLGKDHGGVLEKTRAFSAAWVVTWGLEALCTAAVNCYVLISGYFLVGSRESEDLNADGRPVRSPWRKILNLCLTVWFYTGSLFLIGYAFGWVGISKSSLLHLVTPITGRTYWFVSVYLGLLLLSPYLNKLIKSLTERAHRRLIVGLIALFSLLPTVLPVYDTFQSGGGIGLAWFAVLYLIAAYVRLYGIGGFWRKLEGWRTKHWTLAYLAVTALILLSKLVITAATEKLLGHSAGTSILYQYHSPACLVSAGCLFMAFREMRLPGEKPLGRIATALAPLMLGVYMIHENPSIKGKMWELLSPGVEGSVFLLVLKLFGIVIGITAVCAGIEWVRQRVFALFRRSDERSEEAPAGER